MSTHREFARFFITITLSAFIGLHGAFADAQERGSYSGGIRRSLAANSAEETPSSEIRGSFLAALANSLGVPRGAQGKIEPALLLSAIDNRFQEHEGALITPSRLYDRATISEASNDPLLARAMLKQTEFDSPAIIENLNFLLTLPPEKAFTSKFGPAFIYATENGFRYYPRSMLREDLTLASQRGNFELPSSDMPADGFSMAAASVPMDASIPIGGAATLLGASGTSATSAGTFTPRSKDVAVFWGADHNGATSNPDSGFYYTRNELKALGYNIVEVDARKAWTSSANPEAAMSIIATSPTVFFNVHGSSNGYLVMQCYKDISGFSDFTWPPPPNGVKMPTLECCNKLKDTAIALNLQGASGMDCSDPNNRPMIDPSGSIMLSLPWYQDTKKNDPITCPLAPNVPSGTNRCQIIAKNELFEALGDKDVLATSQCYGGACPISQNTKDFITTHSGLVYGNVEKCDDLILARDISGTGIYCTSPTAPGNENLWPPAISPCHNGKIIAPNPAGGPGFRAVEVSLSKRRRISTSGAPQQCQMQYNATGWQKYNIFGIKGSANSQVEFAPSGQLASLVGKKLQLTLTSTITPTLAKIEYEPYGVRKKRSTDKITHLVGNNGTKVIFNFSNTFDFVPRVEWESLAPDDFKTLYGVSQDSWSTFIDAKVQGKAANGVKLIGNVGSPNIPIIWSTPLLQNAAPLYLNALGNSEPSYGGDLYTVKVPVLPPQSCALPHIEILDGCGPDGRTTHSWIKNGELCQPDTAPSECFVGVCTDASGEIVAQPGMESSNCQGMGQTYQKVSGRMLDWADCCGSGGTTCQPMVEEQLPEPDRCDLDYVSGIQEFQYQVRPWDQNPVDQLEPILTISQCGADGAGPSERSRRGRCPRR